MTEKQTLDKSQWQPVGVIAKLLNLSERRIQQLAQAGHIPSAKRGRYALAPTVQGYCRYMQGLTAEKVDTASAHTAEIQKQRAEKLRRENELAADQFIPARDVAVGVRTAVDHIRTRTLVIPAKVAPEVLAAESVGGVKLILQDHIHAALDELSRTRFVAVGEDGDPKPARKPVKRRRKTAR